MKLGLSYNPNPFTSRYGEERFHRLKSFGVDSLDYELADTNTYYYTAPEEEVNSFLSEEVQRIESAELSVHQVHGPWRCPIKDDTPEDRAERMDKMKRSIRMTKILGAKNWVIHPIFPFSANDADHENGTWELNLEFMTGLLAYAKEHDITICYENMPFLEFSLSRPKDILRFVKTINDEHFKICLDTGHANVFDDLSVGDAVRLLEDEIRAFHIHDNFWNVDMHLSPFYGTIDWTDFAKSLKDISYQGVFSLETTPANTLPSPIYEDAFRTLVDISKHIMCN